MKTQLIIVSVVAVLLAASTGVGFWMLNGSKAALADAQVDLASSEADLTSTRAELNSTKAENAGLNETLTITGARMEIISNIFVPAMKGELDAMTESEAAAWFLEWQGQITDVGDPTLEARWQEFIDSGFTETGVTNFFVYLLESTAEALD